ncbi:MAG: damage-control phosphatase ARMT1 family protein [Bacillota bacterium]
MKAKPECFICSLKQVLSTSSKVTTDTRLQLQVLKTAMSYLASQGPDLTPAELASDLFHLTCRELKTPEPFRPEMDFYNQQGLSLYPRMQTIIGSSPEPIFTAILIAVAGNLIDLGIINDIRIEETITAVLKEGLKLNDYPLLRQDLERAKTLLYILDNAGEIVFDRLLLEEIQKAYPGVAFQIAVKNGPASNDALRTDALEAGLDKLGAIIDTGSASLGIPESRCSKDFWESYQKADIVIAKGHANYETIFKRSRPVYAILRVKCPVVAADLGVAEGDSVLKKLAV